MSKLKNISVILLLVILTALTITAPILFNIFNNKYSINKKSYWKYTPQKNNKLTSNRVVEFINNSYNYNDTVIDDENLLKEKLSKTLTSVVKNDYGMSKFIKELLNNKVNCSQTDYLISFNNSPAVLNVVFAVITTDDANIEIVFEAKTETLISFTADTPVYGSKKMEKLYVCLIEYFEKDLKLSENQYFFEMYNNADRLFISCSLSYGLEDSIIEDYGE